jgi:hypothetical protein
MKNEYRIDRNTVVLDIVQRNGNQHQILFDVDDLKKMKTLNVKWFVTWNENSKGFYGYANMRLGVVNRKTKYKNIYMHRFLTDAEKGEFVDHINHNTLDNRRDNLRITTNQNNLINRHGANRNSTTGVRNVSWHSREQKYAVQFQVDGKNKYIGKFDKLEDAAKCAEEFRNKLYIID